MADDSVSVDSDISRFSDLTEPEASNDSAKTASSGAISLDTRIKLESYLQSESRRTKNENLTEITSNDSITSEVDTVKDDRTKVLNEEIESLPSESTGIKPTDKGLESSTGMQPIDMCLDKTTDISAIDNAEVPIAIDKTLDNYSAIERELVVGSEDSSLGSLKLPVSVPAPVDLGVDDIVGKLLKEGSENSNGRILSILSCLKSHLTDILASI